MKQLVFIIFGIVLIMACQPSEEPSVTEVEALVLDVYDYFEEEIPYSITRYQIENNHDKIAALGRILFYDNRLSQNNSISCANCHKQQIAFSDEKQFSIGLKNYETTRNTLSLTNNAYHVSHFWEGHSGRIEDHVLNPISNHIEMGMRDVDDLVVKLSEIDDYNSLFNEVFDEDISEDLLNQSLTTFIASLISYNSKFDKGKITGFTNFTANELAGKDLFFGKAKCSHCHNGDHFNARWRKTANIGLDHNYVDQGAGDGHFKVPSLRNIAITSPYMHDGRFARLDEVVEHYVSGIKDHPELDWTLSNKIELSESEKELLIDFLHTLTDYEMLSDPKFSNPFN